MRYNELAYELPAICLPHHDGGIPLSAFPNGTTSELSGLFSTLSFDAGRKAGKLFTSAMAKWLRGFALEAGRLGSILSRSNQRL